jgi:hypothetical protein
MTVTPETSEHTGIQKRTEVIQQHKRQAHKLQPIFRTYFKNKFSGIHRQDS